MEAFFTPGQSLQPEVDRTAEMQALQRRQQLIDAMQMRARQTPIQAGSDKQAAFQALASLGQQFLMGKTRDKLAEQERAMQEGVNRAQQQNLEAYLGAREGPGAKEALLRAMTSRDPRLQKLGDMDSARMQQAAGFKDQVVDKILLRVPNSGGPVRKLFEAPRETYKDEMIPGPTGPLLVSRNMLTNEPKAIDRSSRVAVNVDTKGELETAKAYGKVNPEVVKNAQETIIKSQDNLESSKRLLEMLKSPDLITGFAAGPRAGLASLGAFLKITGPDAAAQTQAVIGALANSTLENVDRLKGAISNAERPFLADAAAGRIEWTPEALQHLAGLSIAASHNAMMRAKTQYEKASSVPGAETARDTYAIPAINHTLDEELFTDRGDGLVRYNRMLAGGAKNAPATSTKSYTTKNGLKVYNWDKPNAP